ncbi:MAG TPA: luciferase family protein [Anaerolineales bacterium]|nr:luciferase family protein [Anaerolineales bacterium]
MTVAFILVKQFFNIWPRLRLTSLKRDLVAMGGSMAVKGASSRIKDALLSWPDVSAHPHRFGGTEYRLGKREIGHIHGDWLVDIPFPTKVRHAIVAAGRAEPHHILPDSGWISFYLREDSDVQKAIDLFRESYEIALKQKSKASSSPVVE